MATHTAWCSAAIAAMLLAGCATEPDGDHEPTFAVAGTFTEAATQADMEELNVYVVGQGGSMILMESFPVQFRASGLTATACDAVHDYAESQGYVADVAACALSSSG